MGTVARSGSGQSPLLIVLSGPSGVGKDAVVSRMKELGKPFHFVITATTRPRRPSERDGADYIFLDRRTFLRMIDRDELLEWAAVYGNLYGAPKEQVTKALAEGKDVFIKTDVQGAATIMRLVPDAVTIFLTPANMGELEARLRQRHTESPKALALRLKTSAREMREAAKFDHVVTNHEGRLDEAVEEIEGIVARERLRQPPRRVTL